jgi:hypothetical protein
MIGNLEVSVSDFHKKLCRSDSDTSIEGFTIGRPPVNNGFRPILRRGAMGPQSELL